MTNDELAHGAALLAAATPGPWTHQRGHGHLSMSHTLRDVTGLPIAEMWLTAENKSAANAAAVAWLRTHAAELMADSERINYLELIIRDGSYRSIINDITACCEHAYKVIGPGPALRSNIDAARASGADEPC